MSRLRSRILQYRATPVVAGRRNDDMPAETIAALNVLIVSKGRTDRSRDRRRWGQNRWQAASQFGMADLWTP